MALKFYLDRKDMYIYPWYISDLTATKDIKKLSPVVVDDIFCYIKEDFLRMYYDQESVESVSKFFIDKVVEDKNFFEDIIKNIYEYSQKLTNFTVQVEKIIVANLSDEKILDVYREYMEILRELRTWGWLPVFLDGFDENSLSKFVLGELEKFLKDRDKEKELSNYFSVLSTNEKKSGVQKEELARLEILLKIEEEKDNKNIFEAIKNNNFNKLKDDYPLAFGLLKKHLKDFGWLTYAYSGPTMSLELLAKLIIDNLESGNISKQRQGIIDHSENVKMEKSEMIKELFLPEQLAYLFNVLAELMYIKDYRKHVYQKSYVAMDRILQVMANRLSMGLKDIKYLVLEEIEDALLNNKKEKYHKITQQRLEACCYRVKKGEIKVYQGEEAKTMFNEIKNKEEKNKPKQKITQLKGMIAYKGKVQGRVRIVLVESDVKKVEIGDILVSSATNPDLIVGMKKAAAFVTDSGGIISHAAIVSREMKKPCVVGTREATHLLKDGDLVEVDADNGIVTILKD